MKYLILLGLFVATPLLANEKKPEVILERLTMRCVACHGANGISNQPMYPNLAGQKAGYISKQLKDFKAGRRNNSGTMKSIADSLSDAEIAAAAKYFEGLGK